MTATLTSTCAAELWLAAMLPAIRGAATRTSDPASKASNVARSLRGNLPGVDVLTDEQRAGHPEHYQQHVLHVEPGGEFSITALVWRPGQQTTIHDHVCWCAVGVLAGVEHEVLYRQDLVGGQPVLTECGESLARASTISAFAPPGDIHRVTNVSDEVTVSLHVYGADISALGSSVRRIYL